MNSSNGKHFWPNFVLRSHVISRREIRIRTNAILNEIKTPPARATKIALLLFM